MQNNKHISSVDMIKAEQIMYNKIQAKLKELAEEIRAKQQIELVKSNLEKPTIKIKLNLGKITQG